MGQCNSHKIILISTRLVFKSTRVDVCRTNSEYILHSHNFASHATYDHQYTNTDAASTPEEAELISMFVIDIWISIRSSFNCNEN